MGKKEKKPFFFYRRNKNDRNVLFDFSLRFLFALIRFVAKSKVALLRFEG
jgi:hypothetical protein